MILMFIAGWVGGVIGTLWFGRWLTKRAEKVIAERKGDDGQADGV